MTITKRNGNVRSMGTSGGDQVIDLDGIGLSYPMVAAAARQQLTVRLADSGRKVAALSQQFADQAGQRRPLYGRSTGVGANRTVLSIGDPAANALLLLRSHATSAGEPRSAERVRAMLVVRLNQLAAGGSGVDPSVLDGLLAMIQADALPEIRELGSIGTADLSALATTALALMGEQPTVSPLPLITRFGAADGLAFISSNAAALGDAALALESLAESARAALVIAALTFHAVDGNAEAYSVGVMRATPFPGAGVVCTAMRRLVGADRFGVRTAADGVRLLPARIQDPFGLRALPQVHGPVLDHLSSAGAVVDALINAPTENPLVLAELDGTGLVAHHAGFHMAYLQMAMDSLALAMAKSGQLVLARLAALIEPAFTGLAPFLGDGTPAASGVMICEYVAASALGSIRAAAVPAGLQSVSLSRGVEEDASFASLATVQCLSIAQRYRQLLACELVAAVRANRMRTARPTAGLIDDALDACAGLPASWHDRDLSADLAMAADLVPALACLPTASVTS